MSDPMPDRRIHNFSAGPAALPVSVLRRMQEELFDFRGQGLSLLECSHRSALYQEIHEETMALLREGLGLDDDYEALLLAGGATLQFAMVPLNLLAGRGAAIVVSGAWAKRALADLRRIGSVDVLYDGAASGYRGLPAPQELVCREAAYLHLTSNETIDGLQWRQWPSPTEVAVPLVADMSSDLMSRRIPIHRFGLLYAGAQKNLGIAGLTLVILRRDLLESAADGLPAYLSYKTHAASNSLYNTPPVFSVYALGLILRWIAGLGGVDAIEAVNRRKAAAIYDVIDTSDGFYRSLVDRDVRSTMNVVFHLPTTALEREFVAQAERMGFIGLAGHRSVGGCRASLYNAVEERSARMLAAFMEEFAQWKS